MRSLRSKPADLSHAPSPTREHRAPWLEPLESRLLFSTYTVTTVGDGAGVITPNGSGKFNATTLRAAITAANLHLGADTINFAVNGTIRLGKALPQIGGTLTLDGPGAAKLSVQRNPGALAGSFSVFHINARKTATISGLTIANGTGDADPNTPGDRAGGGIYNAGLLTIKYCTISNNPVTDGEGGGIYNDNNATLSMSSCRVTGNSANASAGGIYNRGTLTVGRSTLANNSAAGIGGGIANFGGTVSLVNTMVTGNSASRGGGIQTYGGNVKVARSNIIGNVATGESGGGIDNYGGTLVVTGSTLSGNTATESSGGAVNGYSGHITLVESTLSSNSADSGGAVSCNSTLNVEKCTVSNNEAYFGGGIQNLSDATIAQSTFSGNSAFGGGGIYNPLYGSVRVSQSTFFDNSADFGGGIYNGGFDNLTAVAVVTNCTFTGNSAVSGGGVYNYFSRTTVINSTLVANTSVSGEASGGGAWNYGYLNLENSLVAGNINGLAQPDDVGGASFGAYNAIGVSGGGGLINGQDGNKVGIPLAHLKLGSLASNGGPTQTIALLPGSAALNAGSNDHALDADGKLLATDQRGNGFARIVGGTVDIGAFEVQSPVVTSQGSVTGVVFNDLDNNRVQDANESGLNGWLVWADLNKDGNLNHNEPRTVTNSAGSYSLASVPAGYQLLRLELRTGWQQTLPRGGGAHGPTIVAGERISGWHFGVKPIAG